MNGIWREAVQQVTALQVHVVGRRIDDPRLPHRRSFTANQGETNLASDVAGQLALQRDNAADRLFVGARPDRRLIVHLDQLRGDAQAIGFTSHAPLEDVVDAELVADCRTVLRTRRYCIIVVRAMTPSVSTWERPS